MMINYSPSLIEQTLEAAAAAAADLCSLPVMSKHGSFSMWWRIKYQPSAVTDFVRRRRSYDQFFRCISEKTDNKRK